MVLSIEVLYYTPSCACFSWKRKMKMNHDYEKLCSEVGKRPWDDLTGNRMIVFCKMHLFSSVLLEHVLYTKGGS